MWEIRIQAETIKNCYIVGSVKFILIVVGVVALVFWFIIAGINFAVLFDEGLCACSPCQNSCVLKGDKVADCPEDFQYGLDCYKVNCKKILGNCTQIPKIIDLSTYLQ